MRKNSARKLLHATLDLLPLIVIPIFGLYYFNHAIDEPLSVTTSGYEITPLYETNDVETLDDLVEGHVYHCTELILTEDRFSNLAIEPISGELLSFSLRFLYIDDSSFIVDTYNLDEFVNDIYTSNSGNYLNYHGEIDSDDYYSFSLGFTNEDFCASVYYPNSVALGDVFGFYLYDVDFIITDNSSHFKAFVDSSSEYFGDLCIPMRSDFQSYDVVYTEGLVYDDTDVGSQFIYSLYHVTDKYFNMGNVFNMKGVYEWFNTTLFGGNAPLAIKLVWEIVLYEFVMDLLMLLYSLFMFFIDFCTSLIERCYVTSKGGK